MFLWSRQFEIARIEAQSSTMRIRVGATVSRGKKILAVACNRNGTLPLFGKAAKRHPWSHHAEIRAIKRAGIENVRGVTIWVYRETRRGMPAFAHPCMDCMDFMRLVEIKRVVYTIPEEPYFKSELV